MQKHTFILLRTLRIMQKKTINNNKRAFTLAEVLVSLALLGVLAAILIPVISRAKPNPNKVMFKKAYSTLENVVAKMINDDTIYPDTTYGFSIETDPTERAGSYNKFCYYLAENLNTIGATACPLSTVSTTPSAPFAITGDGILWYIYPNTSALRFMESASANTFTVKIIVDVNGTNPPNCSADTLSSSLLPSGYTSNSGNTTICPNPDTFIIGVSYKGNLKVGASYMTTDPATTDQTAIDYLSDPLNNK